jgi:two-component system sensor histidine kinase PilS (NtrC family)
MTTGSISLTHNQKVTIEFSRVTLFVLVLLVGLIGFLFQPRFINWTVLAPLYFGVGLSLSLHIFYILRLERFYAQPRLLFFSFLADSVFISALIYSSGQNQSLFMFLHLANIILAGLLFQSRGAMVVAMFTSLSFTLVSLLSIELKGLNYVFLLFLNNTAFFLVAGLSGFLSDQLQVVGEKLAETGLQLKNLSELNEAIVDNSPLGIVTFNARGHVFHRNPEIAKIFSGPLANLNLFEALGAFELSEGSQVKRFERSYAGSDNSAKRNLQISVRALEGAGEGNYVALIEDRTDLKRLEERLRQNEKLAAIGGLAAGIAHEIRNPLAGISGSIEMLTQSTTNDDDKKLMAIVMREIDRLNNLITEFLDYARPEGFPTERTNISDLLSEVVQVASKNKNIPGGLQHDLQIAKNIFIPANANKLRQAFLNIIINAYQAMGDTPHPILRISLSQEKGAAVLRIQDNGGGMSEETRQRIFEPFFTTKSKGTGLGLAMTYKILQSHQARILVESEKGKGSSFEMSFPSEST